MKKWESLLYIAGENVKWGRCIDNNIKHKVAVWPSNFTLRYISKIKHNPCKIWTLIFIATLFITAKINNKSNVH